MTREELHVLTEKQQPNICQITAYKNGEKFEYKSDEKHLELDISADFSDRIRADIIATVVGHDHKDMVVKEDGLTYIETANCVMYKKDPLRVDGTPSELLFDIYTVDREKRKIYITRIGRGESREVEY